MTHDERRLQKAQLRIDLEDENNNLSHLREKARSRGDLISQIGMWMGRTPEINIYRDDNMCSHEGLKVQALGERHVEALDIRPSLQIANEIRESMAKVRDLTLRIARLDGVS